MYLTQGLHRGVQQRSNALATVCAARVSTHAECRVTMPGLVCQ
jgi:hypothetical protein